MPAAAAARGAASSSAGPPLARNWIRAWRKPTSHAASAVGLRLGRSVGLRLGEAAFEKGGYFLFDLKPDQFRIGGGNVFLVDAPRAYANRTSRPGWKPKVQRGYNVRRFLGGRRAWVRSSRLVQERI